MPQPYACLHVKDQTHMSHVFIRYLFVPWSLFVFGVGSHYLRLTQYTPVYFDAGPDNKVHGANTGPIWGRQNPDGPHVGPMNHAIWGVF